MIPYKDRYCIRLLEHWYCVFESSSMLNKSFLLFCVGRGFGTDHPLMLYQMSLNARVSEVTFELYQRADSSSSIFKDEKNQEVTWHRHIVFRHHAWLLPTAFVPYCHRVWARFQAYSAVQTSLHSPWSLHCVCTTEDLEFAVITNPLYLQP